MSPLSAHDILQVWERGQGQHPLDRALTMLACACPSLSWEELAGLSIGRRDAHLLRLREQTFGPRLVGFIECPQCRERLECATRVAEVWVTAEPDEQEQELKLIAEGLTLRFRLPNSWDLAALTGCADVGVARRLLAQRCTLQADRDGVSLSGNELLPEVIAKLATCMAECDPQAEVLLDLACPGCGHRWQAPFDIGSFLWAEIGAQAKRLLREVDALARAYGWREADILSLSVARRQMYLEMVTG